VICSSLPALWWARFTGPLPDSRWNGRWAHTAEPRTPQDKVERPTSGCGRGWRRAARRGVRPLRSATCSSPHGSWGAGPRRTEANRQLKTYATRPNCVSTSDTDTQLVVAKLGHGGGVVRPVDGALAALADGVRSRGGGRGQAGGHRQGKHGRGGKSSGSTKSHGIPSIHGVGTWVAGRDAPPAARAAASARTVSMAVRGADGSMRPSSGVRPRPELSSLHRAARQWMQWQWLRPEWPPTVATTPQSAEESRPNMSPALHRVDRVPIALY